MADSQSDEPRTPECVKAFTLKFRWHQSGWTLTSDGIKGLSLSTHTFPSMLDMIGVMVPELMRLNGQMFPEGEMTHRTTTPETPARDS